MRSILLSLISIFYFTLIAYPQKKELNITLGSGFSFFSGNNSVAHQKSTYYLMAGEPYTVPYGKKPGGVFIAGSNLKFFVHKDLIAGLGGFYQTLNSVSKIDTFQLVGDMPPFDDGFPVDGNSFHKTKLISINPFFGKRFQYKKIMLDVLATFECGFILSNTEKIDIKGNYKYNKKRTIDSKKTDLRTGLKLEAGIKKMFLFIGFSKGISNYYKRYDGGQPKAFSNAVLLGMGYRLK